MRWILREERHDESDDGMVTIHRGSPRSAASPMGGPALSGAASRRSAAPPTFASSLLTGCTAWERAFYPPPPIFPLT